MHAECPSLSQITGLSQITQVCPDYQIMARTTWTKEIPPPRKLGKLYNQDKLLNLENLGLGPWSLVLGPWSSRPCSLVVHGFWPPARLRERGLLARAHDETGLLCMIKQGCRA